MKPTVAPTLDISLHTRREACHGWRKARRDNKSENCVYFLCSKYLKKKKKLCPNFILDANSSFVCLYLGEKKTVHTGKLCYDGVIFVFLSLCFILKSFCMSTKWLTTFISSTLPAKIV